MAYKVSIGFYANIKKTPEQIDDKEIVVLNLGGDPLIQVKNRSSGELSECLSSQLEPSIHNFFFEGNEVRPLSRVSKYFDESVVPKVSDEPPQTEKVASKGKKKKV